MPKKNLPRKRSRIVARAGKRGDVFASYVEHLRRRNLTARSVETYDECLRTFGRWLAEAEIADPCRVTEIQLGHFQVWMNGERRRGGGCFSLSYQAKHIAVVRELYRFLEREGRIFANPALKLRYPKVPRRINRNVLDTEELRALLSVAGKLSVREEIAVRLMALSGLRIGELVALDAVDVNVEAREVVVRRGKGRKDRITFFDVTTQKLLRRHLTRKRRPLVTDRQGKRSKPHQIRDVVRRCAKKLKLAMTPHCLRHTFCTLLLRHGANLKAIAELAGHARLSTTARYTRVDIRELARVYRSAHPRCCP